MARTPGSPLDGYRIVELTISGDSPVIGQRIEQVAWPAGSLVVAARQGRGIVAPDRTHELRPGDQLTMITANRGSDADPKSSLAAPGLAMIRSVPKKGLTGALADPLRG